MPLMLKVFVPVHRGVFNIELHFENGLIRIKQKASHTEVQDRYCRYDGYDRGRQFVRKEPITIINQAAYR